MYNRYSPGPGGQYQRRQIPQPERRPPEPPPPPRPPAPPKPPTPPPAPPCAEPPREASRPEACLRLPFLDRLLPGADNGDLLLLLILLLLLSDGNEDSQSVALTLAIFLFLQ